MQRIKRPEKAPAVLTSKSAAAGRKRLRDFWALDRTRRAQTSVPAPGLLPDEPSLVRSLAAMSEGRCAFCEAEDRLRAHRFRPVGSALPYAPSSNAHLYYLWLADAWQNLFPICEGCVPVEPQFPVVKDRASLPLMRQIEHYLDQDDGLWPSYPPKEAALILDPTSDRDFEKHLIPKLDGELIGGSRKGEVTALVFNLNRPERRNQRYQAYHDRIDRLMKLMIAGVDHSDTPEWQNLFDFSTMEFGGTWFLLLRRIARWIAGGSGTSPRTSRGFILTFFFRLAENGDGASLLKDALGALSLEDKERHGVRWSTGDVYTLRAAIETVEITNFKAIEHLTLSLVQPAATSKVPSSRRAPSMVILGENATGKSSILEAIALALGTQAARNALDISWPRLILDPSQLGRARGHDPQRAKVEISLTTGHSVALNIDHGSPTVRSEFGNQQVPVFAYGAFRRFVASTRRPAPHRHIRNLFDSSTLSNPEPWLKSLPRDQFDMVIRTMRDLLSIEGEFDVIQRERNTRQLRMVTSLTQPDGQVHFSRTPLQAVSSGYRSMLGMLCDIMRGLLDPMVYEGFESFETARGIVLIDEIEAHLHPRWKVQVMTSLRAALPGMTFIVTTHDPLCLRGMGDGEVTVLQRVATIDSQHESQMPILVERVTDLPPVAELRIEQLLTSDFFQLLSSDDAVADRKLAQVGDLIAARARGEELAREDREVLADFEKDVAAALPVGSSEVHRIVQEAVAEYLHRRREASNATLKGLREETKTQILAALEML